MVTTHLYGWVCVYVCECVSVWQTHRQRWECSWETSWARCWLGTRKCPRPFSAVTLSAASSFPTCPDVSLEISGRTCTSICPRWVCACHVFASRIPRIQKAWKTCNGGWKNRFRVPLALSLSPHQPHLRDFLMTGKCTARLWMPKRRRGWRATEM